MNPTISYYDILGVGRAAEAETVRKAYRRLARKHHPDVSPDPKAQENMARINEAYETLIDPYRRNEYDAFLRGGPQDAKEQPVKPVVVKFLRRMPGHRTPVYGIGYSPDTDRLVTSGFDNEILWWNEDGSVGNRTKLENGVVTVLRPMTLDRLVTAGSTENTVSVHRLEDGRQQQWKTAAEEWVGTVAISPGGDAVATGSVHRHLALLDALDGTVRWRNRAHEGAVMAVAYSPDGRVVASGGADATVKLWDAITGDLVANLTRIRAAVTAIAISPDGKYLAAAAVDLSIRVFSLPDGELVKLLYGHTKAIESLAFHPRSWLFASGSRDGTVGLWAAGKGVANVRIEASSRPISAVTFNGAGTRLAAAGQDKLVRLYDVAAKDEA